MGIQKPDEGKAMTATMKITERAEGKLAGNGLPNEEKVIIDIFENNTLKFIQTNT